MAEDNSVQGVSQMPIDRNGYWVDESPSSSSSCSWQPWSSWDEVPDEVPDWARDWFIFLEVFSGTAGVTEAVKSRSCLVLPPIDIVTSEAVKKATDICIDSVWKKVDVWISSGVVDLVHFGTPCSSFSRVSCRWRCYNFNFLN